MSKSTHFREYSSSSSGSEEIEWTEGRTEGKTESNDWSEMRELFDKSCTKSTKTNRRLDEKRVKELNEQKIRAKRELNPYIKFGSTGTDDSTGGRHPQPSHDGQTNSTGSSGVSLQERNAINAKLIKAEIMGNKALIEELKQKLKQLDSNQSSSASASRHSEDRRPEQRSYSVVKSNDDSMSLKEMFLREKQTTAEDENKRFVATTSKSSLKREEEYEESPQKPKKRRHEKNESNMRYMRPEVEDRHCRQCVHNIDKHLVLTIGEKTVITLTPFEPFVKGFCYILSKCHSNVSTISSDEECFAEINERKHEISKFYSKHNLSVVFMETYFKRSHGLAKHLTIECFPIKSKYESEAKIFFKKAIMECEGEWAMNKQVIEIKDKSINKLIPKGLSYFWVTFGAKNDGFAHVIENEDKFSHNFGKEVIGGLLDIQPNKWIKPKHQNYDQQYDRTVGFKQQWNKHFK